MLVNKYDILKNAAKSIPEDLRDDYLKRCNEYSCYVEKHNKMERIYKDREKLFNRVKIDIDKFLTSELYANNGWFISHPCDFTNYEDHIVVDTTYGFNTMLRKPLTIENLNKINNAKKRSWDSLELHIHKIERNLQSGIMVGWYTIPVVNGVDYSNSMNEKNKRFRVTLRFRFNV